MPPTHARTHAGAPAQVAAVKIVYDRDADSGTLNGALELALLTSISHPNIIQIHTYFADLPLSMVKFVNAPQHTKRSTRHVSPDWASDHGHAAAPACLHTRTRPPAQKAWGG